jgi:hypothetical protein
MITMHMWLDHILLTMQNNVCLAYVVLQPKGSKLFLTQPSHMLMEFSFGLGL